MPSEAFTLETNTSATAEPMEIIRLGKDEMNLAEFPITLLADRVPKGKKSIQYQDRIFDEKTGKPLTRKLTISADDVHGLPTAVDDDVVLGLIQLTKLVNNFTSREVEFSRLNLIRLLGWPDSGDSYRRLATSLKRWLSVTLLYENAWRDNRKSAWITKGFHILDNIELNDTRATGEQGEFFPSKIVWNQVVFESFQAGYLKTIDYGLYIKLKHTVSRRMYRFLSKRMYFSPDLTLELRDLAFAHIGLSDSYGNNAGKIKEKLQPALDELEAVGFLEPVSKEHRYRKDGKNWNIHLTQKAPAPLAPAAKQDDLPPPLAAELIRRGVSPKVAAGLVAKFPAETIRAKIEEFDWEMQQPKPPKKPPGYLVKSITDGYAAPAGGFVPAAERRKNEEARQAKERETSEKRRLEREEAAADRDHRQKVKNHLKGMTNGERADLENKALAAASPDERANYAAPYMAQFRPTLMDGMVREYLRPQLSPSEP